MNLKEQQEANERRAVEEAKKRQEKEQRDYYKNRGK